MDITIPRDREAKILARCPGCLRRGRRGGLGKFTQDSPGLAHWRDRHSKHGKAAA